MYGSQRILNGIPKSPHYGLDFAAKEGTEIKAMLDGVVTLSEKNVYVKKGQKIKQGDVIGLVGKTGRATGAHLDIRLNWFDVKLDPASVLKLD